MNRLEILAILVILAGGGGGGLFSESANCAYGRQFNLPIPAEDGLSKGWMADAIIEVPDHFIIHDIDVSITLTHTSAFDLQIILQSPVGTNVLLNPAGNLAFIVRDEDGRLHAYGGSVEWFFDDEAEVSIEQATEPFVGAFRSVENLFSFDGQDACGHWRLRIYDAFPPDTGTLEDFELIINTPEPSTLVFLVMGMTAALFRKHRQ